jgi:uncharacterized membrane protein YkvI
MPRKEINLRTLPTWLQYTIAVTVVGVVAAAAWFVGHEKLVPACIEHYLSPGLGWLGLLLIIIVIVDWFRKRG